MRSPVVAPVLAMLWEHWRLTRAEAAWRLAIGIVGGSGAMTLPNAGAAIAVWLLLSQHGMFWMSIAKLTGGRFTDGYRPGFPLPLLYTRPVSTVAIVGVAMAYDALSCAALYLASAALLGFAFGRPLPLLSAAMLIVVFHVICTCIQWSTRSRVAQWVGSYAIWAVFTAVLYRAGWSILRVEFSFAEIAVLASSGLASFGLTVAGVARQRRGDASVAIPRTAGGGFPEWLVNLFRFACPTSSATAALVWFDLKCSGLPVLAIGAALAILNPLLFVLAGRIDILLSGTYARPVAVSIAMFSLPAMLILGGNAFGIRARQGRTHVGAFEATQACGTARMAGLKVFVRSACMVIALVVVGTSVWTSASVIPFDVLDDNDTFIAKARSPLSGQMRAIEGAVGAMSMYEQLALAFVTIILVAVIVAWRASHVALRARYPRRARIAGALLLLHCALLILLALAARRGIASPALLDIVGPATVWFAAVASVLATAYLVWSVFAERLLTLPQVGVAGLVSVAFGAAWLTLLSTSGVSLAGEPATGVAWLLSPALLPLMASVLAPWSLSRVRHT